MEIAGMIEMVDHGLTQTNPGEIPTIGFIFQLKENIEGILEK